MLVIGHEHITFVFSVAPETIYGLAQIGKTLAIKRRQAEFDKERACVLVNARFAGIYKTSRGKGGGTYAHKPATRHGADGYLRAR